MSNIEEWSLNTSETAKSVGSNSGAKYKVYLAKVLPLVAFGKAKIRQIAITKSCYCNAATCKPSISTKVKSRNYIELSVSKNASTKLKSVKHGTKLRIDIQNKNVDKMYVMSKAESISK